MPEPIMERGNVPSRKPEPAEAGGVRKPPLENPLADLQRLIGNRAVGRLVQRSGGGRAEVDEETADRIQSTRGGGQELDPGVRASMGAAMDQDFSGVRVHTSPESDDLNRQLGAVAFTTGTDVFFSDGAYDPDSTAGRELIAHELTHVVQQGSGQVGGDGAMTVNEPGDAHEQQADAVAEQVAAGPVQLQEEDELPPAGVPDDDEMPGVQRQGDVPEEEEPVPGKVEEPLKEEDELEI
jgi:hypothetical protein